MSQVTVITGSEGSRVIRLGRLGSWSKRSYCVGMWRGCRGGSCRLVWMRCLTLALFFVLVSMSGAVSVEWMGV